VDNADRVKNTYILALDGIYDKSTTL